VDEGTGEFRRAGPGNGAVKPKDRVYKRGGRGGWYRRVTQGAPNNHGGGRRVTWRGKLVCKKKAKKEEKKGSILMTTKERTGH